MLTDEELTQIVRDRLRTELTEVHYSERQLGDLYRRRAQRVRVKTGALAAALVVAVVAIVLPLAAGERGTSSGSTTGTNRSSRVALKGSAVSLAGYETNLPAGYTFAEASTVKQCSNFFVPVGVMPDSGIIPPTPQNFTQLWLNAPSGPGCLAFGLSGNYEPPPGTSADSYDPIAPRGSETTTIGAYRASTYQAPNSPTLALYVQIPTAGGGEHDLIVAAEGMSQTDLIAMLEKALPTAPVPTEPSGGPSTSTTTTSTT